MTDAVIAGIGESKIGKVPEMTTLGLIVDASLKAIEDAGLTAHDIDGIILHPAFHMSPRYHIIVSETLGIYVKTLADTEMAGGASYGLALERAKQAVESGLCKNVLLVGGEKLATGHLSGSAMMASVGAHNLDWEYPYGATIPSYYGLLAQRYFHETGATDADLAEIAVMVRRHASRNPLATYRDEITVDDVLSSPIISSPLHRLDCSLVSDGATAYVVSARGASRDPKREVEFLGIGQGQSFYHMGQLAEGSMDGRHDLVHTVVDVAGDRAFAQAGVSRDDIDVAMIYDSFTITVAVQLEDLGFAERGGAGAFVREHGDLGGKLPINTHGGLLSFAHPGASGGMMSFAEAVRQLRGEAHGRQVEAAEVALVTSASAVASNFTVSILGASRA
ncbi:thiolase C-terminal domain-containing protein [Microbacterium immunditiarum]|uniref:Acetyl-CoA acetyltransferase n=1 Tax=Microbacterium immunditiarum TaxID=337480 RepID=A0A7Y9GL17_9MICO|nr:acetyl-CoA acetyltransferase [Microbacterium immunditiarum]